MPGLGMWWPLGIHSREPLASHGRSLGGDLSVSRDPGVASPPTVGELENLSSTPASPLFPIADAQRLDKGRRWMRAFQVQVAAVWQATVETDTTLVPGGGVETEAETVAIAVAHASIASRVLDHHVFNDEYTRSGKTYCSSQYERFRDSDDEGRVLTGLALIRNSEIHLPVLIDTMRQ